MTFNMHSNEPNIQVVINMISSIMYICSPVADSLTTVCRKVAKPHIVCEIKS